MKFRIIHLACLLLAIVLALSSSCSNNGGLVKLSRTKEAVDFYPTWSPDGSQIAFWSGLLDTSENSPWIWNHWGVFTMDADGSNRFRVAAVESNGSWVRPSWSPGGDQIVFSTGRGGIGITGPEGYDVRFLIPEENDYNYDWPSYSPNGSKILFGKYLRLWLGDGGLLSYWHIFVMDADGTNATELSTDPVNDREPAWSPDGSRIAFASDRDGHDQIYVMDADGGNIVRLANDTRNDSFPVWSPDGDRIAFISTWDYRSQVCVMNSDGSNVVRLTDKWAHQVSLSWSPDGTKLAICGDEKYNDYFGIYLLDVP